MLIYIHGFNSAPQSFKARLLAARMAELGVAHEFRCPALPPAPAAAMAVLEAGVKAAAGTPLALVGSSLGGYYATRLAEQHGCRAVLLNPAVRPLDLLASRIGRQTNLYTGQEYDFTAGHVAQLRALETDAITPSRYLLIVTTGDEVLDYRAAVARYGGCRQVVIEGGDHGLSAFAGCCDDVLRFCGVI